MSRFGRALAICALGLLCLAGPASARSREATAPSAGVFDVSGPAVPMRDVVREYASASSSRKLARAGIDRYPVGDSAGRTVAISVTTACAASTLLCNSANPQTIATFLGTLPHGDEISSLSVQLMTDPEISGACGTGAQACYFPGDERMLISGRDSTGSDGATREFVLAHEYGHHVANNRFNPPFLPTIDWGTKRWSTYERICQGVRSGAYFPGDEGNGYRSNPGEAFAESFAFNRFPSAPVTWAWVSTMKPDAGAFAAIQADTLDPWSGPTRSTFSGVFRPGGRASFTKKLGTPLDGSLVLKLSAPRGDRATLRLRAASGRVLRSLTSRSARRQLSFTICGSSKVEAVVSLTGPTAGRFRLAISRP